MYYGVGEVLSMIWLRGYGIVKINNIIYTPLVNCGNMTEDEIKEQVGLRKHLISTMVGTMYPQMVSREIEELENMITKLKYQESWDGMWEIE